MQCHLRTRDGVCRGIRYFHARSSAQDSRAVAGPHPDEPSVAQVNAAVASFSMLADPTRLRILWALRQGESDVATLAAVAAGRRSPVSTFPSSALLVSSRAPGRLGEFCTGSRVGM